jgi:hypothetical protein
MPMLREFSESKSWELNSPQRIELAMQYHLPLGQILCEMAEDSFAL